MTSSLALVRSLLPLVLREWRHHPGRHAVALLAVALGVALAWSVHLINQSALAEFSSAVRAANGDPDLTLRGQREGFHDAVFDTVVARPEVAQASPVLEVDTFARRSTEQRLSLRVLGIDALRVGNLAPALWPRPAEGSPRYAMLNPTLAFVNASARAQLALRDGDALLLQAGPRWLQVQVAGSVAASGPPLVVMDLAGVQHQFGMAGRLTRIDLRLQPGAAMAQLQAALQGLLPGDVRLQAPGQAEQRVSNLSRAYRVNLTVLALVALFVGAFLVYSVLALSVAQRSAALALLGVLGMTAAERRWLVLSECALVGLAGTLLGLAAGVGMAHVALQLLAGDLGGGYFPGITPPLQVTPGAALVFFVLGLASALIGGWVPARQAERLVPAQALKGLGNTSQHTLPLWPALLLLAAGGVLALLPPVAGLPLAAYAAVAALLLGGVLAIPALVQMLLAWQRPPRHPLLLLAWRRARLHRHTATAAVSGVVASLALSVALTVMVTSFRQGVSEWLDHILPADLYARTSGSAIASDQAWFDAGTLQALSRLPEVARVSASRSRAIQWQPDQPAVVLLARPLQGDVSELLPMLASPLPRTPGEIGIYASEAMAALYGARAGEWLELPLAGRSHRVRVLGVWRDFARQFGSIVIDLEDYRRLSGDQRLNELALWLAPGASMAAVQQSLREAMPDPSMIEFAATTELRQLSLRIFDRSFAVTRYLQVVAIGIGLVGVAASLSAQVLARRKEFGLLAHLGLTQRQVTGLVAIEAAAWLAAGVLLGTLLGLLVSVVLVHVVNPQSFHWTMTMVLPGGRLAALAAAVWLAGVATAAFSARRALSRAAVLSVKEDW